MKLVRQSLVHKTSFLTFLLLFAGVGFYFAVSRVGAQSFTVTAGQLLLILYVFFGILLIFFITHVLQPLQKVTRQMKAVLAGKSYQKIEFKDKIDELSLLAKFFNEVITSLENVSGQITDRKRLKEELSFASKVQTGLMPKKAPHIPGLDVVVKTRSAAEIGGDNFDIIQPPNSKTTIMYIGDVTGHGVPAGLVMSMVNVLVHAFASVTKNTRDLLVNVNHCLSPKINATMFMTLIMLRWEHETQKLFYTGCGHEHLLIYRTAKKKCEAIKTGGIALGMVPKIDDIVKEREIRLDPSDTVILFSDGITEAKNSSGEMFGLERLRRLVEEYAFHGKAQAIFEGISKEFSQFVGPGHIQQDDITLLVLKYNFKGIRSDKKLALDVSTEGITAIEKPNWEW